MSASISTPGILRRWVRRIPGLAVPLIVSAGVGCSDDARPIATAPAIGSTASALAGGENDVNSAEANVVVAMTCTGTLITPRIALTAAHCIWGSKDLTEDKCYGHASPSAVTVTTLGSAGTGTGPTFDLDTRRKYATRIDHCFDATPLGSDSRSQDIAVVYLNEPVTESSMHARVGGQTYAVPRVTRPGLVAPPEVDGHYADVIGAASVERAGEARGGRSG